jgi:hypothetical protein
LQSRSFEFNFYFELADIPFQVPQGFSKRLTGEI